MANENLVIGIGADLSDLIAGFGVSEAKLKEFQAQVQQLSRALPDINPRDFMQGVREGIQAGIQDIHQMERAVHPMAQAMTQANSGTAKFAEGLRNISAQNAAAANATRGLGASLNVSSQALNKFRSGMASAAVQAAGTTGAIGQMAQGMAFAFGGAGAIIGVSAAVLIWNQLTKATRAARDELDKYIDQQKQLNAAAVTPMTKFIEGMKEAQARIKQLTDEFGKLERQSLSQGTGRLQPRQKEILEDIAVVQQTINRLTKEWGDVEFQAGEEARRAADAVAEAKKRAAAATKAELDAILALQHATRVANAGGGNRTAGAGGTATGPLTGGLLSGASADEITESRGRVADATAEAVRQTLELAAATAQWAVEEANALRASEQAFEVDKVERMAGAVQDLVFGLSTVVDVLGLMDGQASKALQTLESIGLAIASGDILGAIGGGISFIGSMFGTDATQREHADILRRNNEALADTTAAIHDWDDSIEAARSAQADIGALDPAVLRGIESLISGSGQFGELGTNILDAELRKLGSSLAELDAIARANGIQLLDEKGRLVAGALDQLREALKLAEEAETKRAAEEAAEKAAKDAAERERELARAAKEAAREAIRLAEELARARIAAGVQAAALSDLGNQLLGVTDPLEIFKQHMIALGVGSSDTAAFFGAVGPIDVNTPALREALKNKILDWIEQAQSGALQPEDLGLNQEQFNQLLQDSIGFLNDFAAGVEAAASAAREDARRQLALLSRLEGDPQDPVGKFMRELGILGDAIPDLVENFVGLRVDDPANAEALRDRLLALFDQIGNIPPELKDEFLEFLGLGADMLDDFTDAADQATKSLQNLPKGLNLAEYEWRTRMALPGRPGDGASLPQFGSPIISPTMPASQPTSAGSSVAINGPVTIQLRDVGTKSPDELAREIIGALKRLGMGRTGSPFDFG